MATEKHNLLENIPALLSQELQETLAQNPQARIERIVSQGHVTPPDQWYDQKEDEFVLLITGQARLQFTDPDDTLDLHPGDWIHIASHTRHRVVWTDPDQDTIWLAVFLNPRLG